MTRAADTLRAGPLRCRDAAGGRRRVRAVLDAGGLALEPHSSPLDGDWLAPVAAIGGLGVAFGGIALGGRLGAALAVLGLLPLVAVLVLHLAGYAAAAVGLVVIAGRALTRGGRRRLAATAADSVQRVRESSAPVRLGWHDLQGCSPVQGLLRVRTVLTTTGGEVHLAGWWWRRGGLERLVGALDPGRFGRPPPPTSAHAQSSAPWWR